MFTTVNDTIWNNIKNLPIETCYFTGGCTNAVPYVLFSSIATAIFVILIILYIFKRRFFYKEDISIV